MEGFDNKKTTAAVSQTGGLPEHFEVYSPWGQKAAGLGGIALFSALNLGIAGFVCYLISDFQADLFFLAAPMFLFFMLIFANIVVKLYRFNLGRKIVVDKDRLTVGGRSWDVLNLIECVDVAITDGSQFHQYTTHEYAVCDKNGKAIAYFDERYHNSVWLKRWLREGGCKLTHREPNEFLFYLRTLI